MKIVLVDLEITFQPCLSVITWSSLKLPKMCEQIEEAIKDAQIFIKEVKDIKEARIDEIFESITETTILDFNYNPRSPKELLADTIISRDKVGIELEIKSLAAERAVIMIINQFMHRITDPALQEIKFNWLDPEKVHRPARSESKLIQAPYEPGILRLLKRGFTLYN